MSNETPEQCREKERRILEQSRTAPQPAGWYSNQIIRSRNGGVRHQFESDIGGCSDNYR